MTNYLITGSRGRLGKELTKHLKGFAPSRKNLDITQEELGGFGCDVLVHLAAYTNVDRAQEEPFECFETNVYGTYNLLKQFNFTPIVFISTEHVNAEGVYFESKRIGELLVKNLASSYLIIRTLFKPNPYPWDKAWIDQMTQGDYVDVIAQLIAKEITQWDGVSKTIYVGTGRKSMYELALRTKPDVTPSLVEDAPGLRRPKDYLL